MMRRFGQSNPKLIGVDEFAFAPDRENLGRFGRVMEDAIRLEDEFARIVCAHITAGLAAERECE